MGLADLPFLTLPDPVTTGEGALDPLGLSTIGERLADQVLPGLRARMSRPRFLTAIAVSAAVCEVASRCAPEHICGDPVSSGSMGSISRWRVTLAS